MTSLVRKLRSSALKVGLALAAIGITGTAMADPISYIPGGAGISIKFVDREIATQVGGPDLFGIFNITQINSADSSSTYWTGNGVTDGTQLVGYFQGLTPVADQTHSGGLSFTGGTIEMFLVPNGTYKPGVTPNTLNPNGQLCGGACATPWLTLAFVPGINDSINGNATLQAAVASTNVQAGFGFMSVTGGTNAAAFDTNGFSFKNFAPADMSFKSDFSLQNANSCSASINNGWQVCSDDPITANRVPEPGTLALMGLGLLGLGLIRRRQYTK